jgi:[ribosomal protein S5]-alanine N-acetyltransferase
MTPETRRLRLLPYSPAHYLALIDGVEPFERLVGLRAAPGLRDFIVSAEVSPAWLARLRAATAADVWEHGFGISHKADGLVIGNVGFKGPPDAEGIVEIAYGVVPTYERQGIATEAAGAMIAFAAGDQCVRRIRAHTLPTNPGSIRVLEKNGFVSFGEVIDPEDGPVSRFERPI